MNNFFNSQGWKTYKDSTSKKWVTESLDLPLAGYGSTPMEALRSFLACVHAYIRTAALPTEVSEAKE